jgi:glucoside 3-dehydrogenase (cytochrome c) hitch-hiker subunit
MKRRDLLQSILLTTGSAIAAFPAAGVERPANYDASKELARANWKPVFLDEHQDRTLVALSDLMIPATDTPGAKEALVNRFLDLILAAEKEETQREFLASLAYVDAESMRQYRQAFVYLDQPSQTELMHFLAYPHSLSRWGEAVAENDGYAHFERLKRWIASAYYNSEIGLKELGWDGTFPHGELTGCGAAGGKATAHDMNHMHSQDAAGRTGG